MRKKRIEEGGANGEGEAFNLIMLNPANLMDLSATSGAKEFAVGREREEGPDEAGVALQRVR